MNRRLLIIGPWRGMFSLAMRRKGINSPSEAIAPPVNPQAKPTCYMPRPNNPAGGKRRRQWR
ncbi:hypothetical protein R2APBS1_2819 [Rhodanobacter denitrificans]|uniref:Uncharacterized protein n=1 Tax=Rhodanobacter denitrificans TaxID=666685 RepID=M4NQM4_9GAMM|nr:hypothetical protein R2APBS1_2819 [Rhodanobacter denitrificans]